MKMVQNGRISDFRGLLTLTLTLDPGMVITFLSSLIEYYLYTKFHRNRRNFLWPDRHTDTQTDGNLPPIVLGLVLLRFQKFCCRSVSVGFARNTAVFGSVFVCPVFPLSSMWYVYAAHCTSSLQQYVTYFCV